MLPAAPLPADRGPSAAPGPPRHRRHRPVGQFSDAQRPRRRSRQGLQPPARPQGFFRTERPGRRRRRQRAGNRHRARRSRLRRHHLLPQIRVLPPQARQRRPPQSPDERPDGRRAGRAPQQRAADDRRRRFPRRRQKTRAHHHDVREQGQGDSRQPSRHHRFGRADAHAAQRRGLPDDRPRGAARFFPSLGRQSHRRPRRRLVDRTSRDVLPLLLGL